MSDTLSHCDVTRLEGVQRLTFLPALFGADFMAAEATMYAYADRFCENYQGGFWEYYRLPNGSGFMVPEGETLLFCSSDNWFEQEVSAEVAGIIITALVLNHRSWHHSHHDRGELCQHFCKQYELLMDFISTHPDAGVIYRALD
ncbi:antirestriction protein [Enterobacter sp.]|uniref:antirestriction protein n=1 Tax=Enterobacter sp. TaxID=42895 RepID=UPI00296F99A5|nr:antirestriction protein [Enterobacter sp.]